jgi:hypothetical protein
MNEDNKPSNPTRRRWLQAGLSAPPVVMTVVSRPVLGATQFCVPPSAYVSLPTSTPGMYGDCSGNGPDTWKDANGWPQQYPQSRKFNRDFSPPLDDNPTYLQMLSGDNDVAKYIVAAKLNLVAGLVPEGVLSAATLQHIWGEYATSGGFKPTTSGATWGPAEIVDYLRSTMTSS